MGNPAEVERWHQAAQDALAAGDVERALEAAAELRTLRHSSGFELGALAHLQAGATEPALELLREGVQRAPRVWLLWQLLGKTLSEAERFEEAHAAFDQALTCPQVDTVSVDLNRATLMGREGRGEEALRFLRTRSPGEHVLRFAACAAELHLALQQPAEARDAAMLALDAPAADGAESAILAHLSCLLAEAHLDLGERDAARLAAHETLSLERGHEHGLWCLREVDGEPNQDGQVWRLMLRGERSLPGGDGDARGFFTVYQVVARSQDEAFAMAVQLEPESVRDSLHVAEAEASAVPPELPTGVYAVSGYSLHPAEEGA